MVDSVKVYTKLKESFNWPDDSDDSPDSTMTKAAAPGSSNVSSAEAATEGVASATMAAPTPLTSADRYVVIFASISESILCTFFSSLCQRLLLCTASTMQ